MGIQCCQGGGYNQCEVFQTLHDGKLYWTILVCPILMLLTLYITVTRRKQKGKLSYSLFLSRYVRRGWGGVGNAVEPIRKVELTVAEFLVIMWSILSFIWSPTSELERGPLVAQGCQKGDCEDKSLQESFMGSIGGSGMYKNNNNNNRWLLYSAILWCTQTPCALQHSPTFSKFHKHNTYNFDN